MDAPHPLLRLAAVTLAVGCFFSDGGPLTTPPPYAGATFGACAPGGCSGDVRCLRSPVAASNGEELCTLPCRTDADCDLSRSLPAVCAGDGSERHCHRPCGDAGTCYAEERCVATADGAQRVCVPWPRAYGRCSEPGVRCRGGTTCVATAGRGGATGGVCTVTGCRTADDCPERAFGQADCVSDPRDPSRTLCMLRCRTDTDCAWFGTLCVGGGDDAWTGRCVPP